MLAFVDGVHFKNGVEVPPQREKIKIYKVTSVPTIVMFILVMR